MSEGSTGGSGSQEGAGSTHSAEDILADLFSVSLDLSSGGSDMPESSSKAIARLDQAIRHVRSYAANAARSSRREGELRRTNRDLNSERELQQDAIAMLGHDLRAPLTVVLGYLHEVLDEGAELDGELRVPLQRAQFAAQRTQALVENILALAVSGEREVMAKAQVVDLAAALPEILLTLPRGRRVGLDVDPAVRPVRFDRSQLSQILSNLILNAFRHGEEPVWITARRSSKHTSVAVWDAGPGVDPGLVERLFKKDPTVACSGSTTGSGLGLYISQLLARANNAHLSYSGAVTGGGHHFVLEVPD